MSRKKILNGIDLILRMIRYNFRIIFAGRFLWFLLSAFMMLVFIAITSVWNGNVPDERYVYAILLFPAVLLIFYPMTFGIQNDLDAGILEILFGIPDYRYKIWLIRMVLVFIIVYLILVLFAAVCSVFLAPVGVLAMAWQIMYPVLFLGTMAFMFSTIIRNGNGTAVVMVILGALAFIASDSISRTMWNIFLNPFGIPSNMNEMIWQELVVKNRILLLVGAILFFLFGLFNLQKREKFI